METIIKEAENLEEWLWTEEAKLSNHTSLRQKGFELENLFNTINRRKLESEERSNYLAKAFEIFDSIKKAMRDVKKERKWITEEQLNKSLSNLEKNVDWLKNISLQQEELKLNEDPVLRVRDIGRTVEDSKELLYKLKSIPDPSAKKSSSSSSSYSKKKSKDDFSFNTSIRKIVDILKVDEEGIKKLTEHYGDLDTSVSSFTEIMDFIKNNNITTNMGSNGSSDDKSDEDSTINSGEREEDTNDKNIGEGGSSDESSRTSENAKEETTESSEDSKDEDL